MFTISEYCGIINPVRHDFLEIMKERRWLREEINKEEHMTRKELDKLDELKQEMRNSVITGWKDILATHIKYRKVFIANSQYLDALPKGEVIYVYPIFLKPGKHQYVVKDAN